jgi:hypothetical protein
LTPQFGCFEAIAQAHAQRLEAKAHPTKAL